MLLIYVVYRIAYKWAVICGTPTYMSIAVTLYRPELQSIHCNWGLGRLFLDFPRSSRRRRNPTVTVTVMVKAYFHFYWTLAPEG